MKITLDFYGTRYTVESETEEYNSLELKDIFSRIMVAAGFPPSVLEPEDGGEYQFVNDDEIVIKKEELEVKNETVHN